MSSFPLDKLHVSWEKQRVLMVERHDDECMDYKRERDAKKKSAIEKAQLELEILRNTVAPTAFDEQARKVYRDRDNEVANIQKEYSECLRAIKELQRKEKLNHDTAYHEAIAARSSRSTLLAPSASATVTADNARSAGGATSQVPARNAASIPSRESMLPAEESKGKKPLRVNTAIGPLPTPTPTVSAAEDADVSRTVTFAEVYQNGEAEHKDTIIEYPPNSDQWYILMCEVHQVRFTQRPLFGAGKHLNGQNHGFQSRSDKRGIINTLGYRVLGCNRELAALNNEAVKKAFEDGYIPMGIKKPYVGVAAKRGLQSGNAAYVADTTAVSKGNRTLTKRRRRRVYTSVKAQPGLFPMDPSHIITNPKTFHVYYCYWRAEKGMCPVLILGWNDQKQGGLEHNLAGTGLLDRKTSRPPNCYIYEATNDGVCGSIIAWAPGFEDGGPKVRRRRFPVMFFDKQQSVAWVSAKALSRFPLFDPDAPKQKNHPFNAARRWIIKKEGFSSWEEFEKARKPEDAVLDRSSAILAPGVSVKKTRNDDDEVSDTDSTDTGSGMDASIASSISNTTERELQALQDKAGEISGDSDYNASDAGSVLGAEYEQTWTQELDGSKRRPWAFYSLRNTEDAGKDQSANPSQNIKSSVSESTETHKFPAFKYAQEDNTSSKDGSNRGSSHSESSKRVEGRVTKDGDDKLSNNTPQTAASMRTIKDWLTRAPLSAAETKDNQTPAGVKRVRSEGEGEADLDAHAPGQELMKKPKLDRDTSSDKQMTVSPMPDPASAHVRPQALGAFKPKLPLELAGFELSSYEKEPIFWANEGEKPCAKLYYGEGDMMVGTVDGPVDVIINPMALEGFKRDEIPGSKGNSVMTLLSKDPGEASMRLVFDRSKGSKAEIGKIQVRSFIRWLRSVNPSIRLLEA
ncbi:hypothetical protein F4861DRAFT_495194 [Xylaria intraflava]|nr:hypothetical protein F4861DRAFT_495194 [Xylaria intraflava]